MPSEFYSGFVTANDGDFVLAKRNKNLNKLFPKLKIGAQLRESFIHDGKH